jgi:hypothetical protein
LAVTHAIGDEAQQCTADLRSRPAEPTRAAKWLCKWLFSARLVHTRPTLFAGPPGNGWILRSEPDAERKDAGKANGRDVWMRDTDRHGRAHPWPGRNVHAGHGRGWEAYTRRTQCPVDDAGTARESETHGPSRRARPQATSNPGRASPPWQCEASCGKS